MQTRIPVNQLLIATSLIFTMACGTANLTAPTATPTAVPFTPTATTPPTATPKPTSTPITLYVDGANEDALETTVTQHKSGAFDFKAPKGWTVDEYENSVFITSPENISFYIGVFNVGYELDATSFSNFIANTEASYYTYLDEYAELSRETDTKLKLEAIEKTYKISNGKTYLAHSSYQQFGQAIYTVELIGPYDEILKNPAHRQVYNAFYESIVAHSDIAATLPLYNITWGYQTNDQAYTLSLPLGWKQDYYDVTIGFTRQEQFTSPDGNAMIQIFSVPDAAFETDSKSLEEYSALIINSAYTGGTNDLKVIKRDEESNRILYEWESPANRLHGYAYIFGETSSSEAWLVVAYWGKNSEKVYHQVVLNIMNSLIIN